MAETTNNENTYEPYVKNTWTDDDTLLSAENLNKIETGLEDASKQLSLLSQTVKDLSENPAVDEGLQGEIDKLWDWTEEHLTYYELLSGDVETAQEQITNHTGTDNGNPHTMYALKEQTYTITKLDKMLSPVGVVAEEGFEALTLECPDIGNFSHSVRLDLEPLYSEGADEYSGGQLWDLNSIGSATTLDFGSLTDSIIGTLLANNWQQLDSISNNITFTSQMLRDNFSGIPTSYLSQGKSLAIELGSSSNDARIALVLHNSNINRYYIIDLGYERQSIMYISDNKLFLKRLGALEKSLINIFDSQNTRIVSVLIENTNSTGNYTIYTSAELSKYTFILQAAGSKAAEKPDIYQAGSYLISYDPQVDSSTGTDLAAQDDPGQTESEASIAYGLLTGGPSTVGLKCQLSYFKNDTRLGEIFKLSPAASAVETSDKDYTDDLQKLISVGTTDPTGITPGLLYFKYLQ